MVRFEWCEEPEEQSDTTPSVMYLDDVPIRAHVTRVKGNVVTIRFDDTEGAGLLLTQRISDLPFALYTIPGPPGVFEWWTGSTLAMFVGGPDAIIQATLSHSWESWARPWTFSDYAREIAVVYDSLAYKRKYIIESSAISIQCKRLVSLDSRLDELVELSEALRSCHEQAERNLAEQIRPDAVVTYFDFPPEAKTACGQYLLYFGQFLADLGVEADVDLKEEMGKVLFAVTPITAKDALGKIRIALDTYLRLASSPFDDGAPALGYELQVHSLKSQIHHLKGQLEVAQAVKEAKQATIDAQQLAIGLLNAEIILNSVTITNAPEEAANKSDEPILGGLVTLNKYKGKGFDIDVPEAYRRLKKLFKEERE